MGVSDVFSTRHFAGVLSQLASSRGTEPLDAQQLTVALTMAHGAATALHTSGGGRAQSSLTSVRLMAWALSGITPSLFAGRFSLPLLFPDVNGVMAPASSLFFNDAGEAYAWHSLLHIQTSHLRSTPELHT